MMLSCERDWFVEVDEVGSTQTLASELLKTGDGTVSAVFAQHQSLGKGRFQREWYSQRGDSLTMSVLFRAYADHPQPWLIGMSSACAAAEAIQCQLQWPNDLVHGGMKLGGVLTEMLPDALGRRVPVVGIGINLNSIQLPASIAKTATSLRSVRGTFAGTSPPFESKLIAHRVLEVIRSMPEPTSWKVLAPIWERFDCTEGKRFQLPDGRIGIAKRIGESGELLCEVDGMLERVLAANAWFGD